MRFALTSAQSMLQEKARELACGAITERAAEIDRTEEYPWDNVALLTEAGFFGMTIPTAYGGQGASYLDAVLVIEEMAKCCGITGRIVVEANMGAIGAIMKYGSEPQKRLAAEMVLAGDKPAICITEPGAGSAASEMITRADRHGNGFVLNGRKHWITGGGVSRLHLVFARVFDARGRGGGHRRHSSPFVTGRPACGSARANRRWACAAFPRPRSSLKTWHCPPTRWCCRRAACAGDSPI